MHNKGGCLQAFFFHSAQPTRLPVDLTVHPNQDNRLLRNNLGCFDSGRVKKKKRVITPGKKKPATTSKRNPVPALKRRLDAEFATAVASAKTYVGNPSRLTALFEEAVKEAASMPREPFGETWPYLQAMLRLIRAYADGQYRNISESTLVVIVAAI